jgi:hypothetical protein
MGSFKNKVQGAITGAKHKIQDSKFNSKLKNADLCSYYGAWKIVYPEFEEIIGRSNWSEPAPDQDSESYRLQISDLVSRTWGDKYDPKKFIGSISAIFNLTIIFFICRHELEVKSETFLSSLDWALAESSMDDINAYFNSEIFVDSPQAENLSILLPRYMKKFLPGEDLDSRMQIVQSKLEYLADLHILGKEQNLIFWSEGLRGSFLEKGSGPRANLVRYLEYYDHLFLDEKYITPIFFLRQTLRPDTGLPSEHWLFCQDGILVVESLNNEKQCVYITLDSVNQITFGQAVWGKITDGHITFAFYKIYMSIELSDGTTITRFEDVSSNQNEFLKIFYDKVEGVISLIEDYYPVILVDEIYEDFDTYVTTTTTTTTTTYTFGVVTD